jgi:hypothetical protein
MAQTDPQAAARAPNSRAHEFSREVLARGLKVKNPAAPVVKREAEED